MTTEFNFRDIAFSIAACGVALLLFSGCVPQSEISTYSVEQPDGNVMTSDRLMPVFSARVAAPVQEPQFEKPEGWRKAAADQFSLLAYAAGPNDRTARITVTRTPASAGLIVQLNRWRSQVKLEPQGQADLKAESEEIVIGGEQGIFVRFDAPDDDDSIAGAIVTRAGQQWFFKMRGPKETVDEEVLQLREFCENASIE